MSQNRTNQGLLLGPFCRLTGTSLEPLANFRQSLEGLFSEVELPLNGFLRSSLRASITKQRQKYAVWVMRYDDRSWYGASQQERSEDQNRVFSEGRYPLGCGEPVVQPATAYIP